MGMYAYKFNYNKITLCVRREIFLYFKINRTVFPLGILFPIIIYSFFFLVSCHVITVGAIRRIII